MLLPSRFLQAKYKRGRPLKNVMTRYLVAKKHYSQVQPPFAVTLFVAPFLDSAVLDKVWLNSSV
jgi:hypothetical protein